MSRQITFNFNFDEFSCRCGCGHDFISVSLVHRLQVIRDIIKVPIIIHSGCRCRKHNAAIGGAPNSLHLTGHAADWSVIAEEPRKRHLHVMLAEMLVEWSGGFHYYLDGDFFHCDIGKKRRWQ